MKIAINTFQRIEKQIDLDTPKKNVTQTAFYQTTKERHLNLNELLKNHFTENLIK